MDRMEKAFDKAEELSAAVKEYVRNSIELTKLRAAAKGSVMTAHTVFIVLLSVLFILAAGFTGAALALLAGLWSGHLWMGLLLVALLFLFIAWMIWLRREKAILRPLVSYLLQKITAENEKDQ